jgi:SNF2 family DNA or RNA helicase
MICTEAGGQGINLQFCHQLINYDLPWNPMRVEQRIGRIHRLGQTHEVQVFNLSTIGTVEEHLLNLLGEKLRMFQMVIGDLQKLNSAWGQSFESKIMEAIVEAHDEEALKQNIDVLGKDLDSTLKQENSGWDEVL